MRTRTFASRATVRRAAAWQLLGDVRLSGYLAEQVTPLDGSSRDHALAGSLLGATARWLADDAAAVDFLTRAGQLGRERDPVSAVAAYGHLALIAAEHNDWQTCDVNVKTAFHVIAESELQEYWMGSFAHVAKGRLLGKQRKTSEAQAELTRAVTLARRGGGVVALAYVLITVAEACCELGDRPSAIELVREARELSAHAPDPGTVVPRLLDKAERSLRLVSEPQGSRLEAELCGAQPWLPLSRQTGSTTRTAPAGYLQQSRLTRSAYPTLLLRNDSGSVGTCGRDAPAAVPLGKSRGRTGAPARPLRLG